MEILELSVTGSIFDVIFTSFLQKNSTFPISIKQTLFVSLKVELLWSNLVLRSNNTCAPGAQACFNSIYGGKALVFWPAIYQAPRIWNLGLDELIYRFCLVWDRHSPDIEIYLMMGYFRPSMKITLLRSYPIHSHVLKASFLSSLLNQRFKGIHLLESATMFKIVYRSFTILIKPCCASRQSTQRKNPVGYFTHILNGM